MAEQNPISQFFLNINKTGMYDDISCNFITMNNESYMVIIVNNIAHPHDGKIILLDHLIGPMMKYISVECEVIGKVPNQQLIIYRSILYNNRYKYYVQFTKTI